jgi:hypothetical protein
MSIARRGWESAPRRNASDRRRYIARLQDLYVPVEVRRKIVELKKLDGFDRAYLALFMMAMHARTDSAAAAMETSMNRLHEIVSDLEDAKGPVALQNERHPLGAYEGETPKQVGGLCHRAGLKTRGTQCLQYLHLLQPHKCSCHPTH